MSDVSEQNRETGQPVVAERRRSWFARHKILTVIGVVLVLGFLGNASKKQDLDLQQAGSPSASGPAVEAEAQTDHPEIVVSAIELSQAFQENEIRANQTYKGKLAQIQGEVFNVGEIFGKTVVTLKGAPWSPMISCAFRDKSADGRIVALNEGTPVTLVGTINGKALGVNVSKCSFAFTQ